MNRGAIKKPWLWLPASLSHKLSPLALKIYSRVFPSREPFRWKSFHWKNIYFPNPLGTAGGVDKNSLNVRDWWVLGAGFCEVGTITPKAQKPNPGRVLARDISTESLWNHLGFPNKGLDFALSRLKTLPPAGKRPAPVFANIGKNRDTPLNQALSDYHTCIKALSPYVEAFVINISSPNTEGLRELFAGRNLVPFLKSLKAAPGLGHRPLILKMSPDLSDSDFLRVVEESLQLGIDGFSICNSTLARKTGSSFPVYGGLSGRPLKDRSLYLLKLLKAKSLEKKALIISVGGVLSPEDVTERLTAGAHLVQVYSALVFNGPGFFKSCSFALA